MHFFHLFWRASVPDDGISLCRIFPDFTARPAAAHTLLCRFGLLQRRPSAAGGRRPVGFTGPWKWSPAACAPLACCKCGSIPFWNHCFNQENNSPVALHAGQYSTTSESWHVKELLRNGNSKTYEVAMRCGYENPTYFSTIFKRRTGVSPSEYRGE